MPIDDSGLRRRSPNPNPPSPALLSPYSPALLSPYVRDGEVADTRATWGLYPSDELEVPSLTSRSQKESNGPTIRLVSSTEAPPTARSRSNDERYRTFDPDLVTALRRNRTDPKVYNSAERLDRSRQHADVLLFPRDHRDRPVPPLPLNIRRPPSVTSHVSTSTAGSCSRLSTHTENRPPSSMFDSKSLRNPFSIAPSSPTNSMLSRRSFASTDSSRTRSSYSSTSTVAVPFYPSAFKHEKSSSNTIATQDVSEKMTTKSPVNESTAKTERWTGYKCVLLISSLIVFGYGVAGLTWALLILGRVNANSEVTMVTDLDLVIFLLLASLLCIFSALVGVTGALVHSRPILAFYSLLLWPTLLSMCLIGYTAYKRGSLQLDSKLNQTWSQFLDDASRLRIQNSLRCCGYYNPFHDATYSKKCYPRTTLPGCKGRWVHFERHSLHLFSTAAFSTIGLHLCNIVIALLSSNHVDRTFGNGLTPVAYRLRMADVRANAVAVLKALPSGRVNSSKTSLTRQPAITRKR